MSAFGRIRAWTRGLLFRRALEREMRDEMETHIAEATKRFVARGMSERDAASAARREFGHVTGIQEQAREIRAAATLDGIAGDIRYAFRYFARTPLATITIVLTLMIGIGVSTGIFSVLDGLLRRPAPLVPNDPALVRILGVRSQPRDERALSFSEVTGYAALTGEFASVAAWTESEVIVDDGRSEVNVIAADAQFVTANFFSALAVAPAAGRFFAQSRFDELTPPEFTVVVSHSMAKERLGGIAQAVGKHLTINGFSFTVAGVMPYGFRGAQPAGADPLVWLPLSTLPSLRGSGTNPLADPGAAVFEAFAWLQPGIRMSDASNSVRLVAAHADGDARSREARAWIASAELVRLRGMMHVSSSNEIATAITLFATLGVLILLMCTSTVSSLLVGAAVARRHEIGVRLALGASRVRVVRQLLTETTILSFAGGALGLALLFALCRIVETVRAGVDVVPNALTVTFTIAYAVLTATLAGLSPALHATRRGLSDVLKEGARVSTRSRLQRTFVIAQVAISLPLLVALSATIVELVDEIPATHNATIRDHVLMARFETELGPNAAGPDRIPDLMRAIGALPGVVTVLPMNDGDRWASITRTTFGAGLERIQEQRTTWVAMAPVPPGYFSAMGTPIVRGRDFVASDSTLSVIPIIVDERTAGQWAPDAIGMRVFENTEGSGRPLEYEIVGIVRADRDEQESTILFTPFTRRREGSLLIRTAGAADSLVPTILALARAEARMLPLTKLESLGSRDREQRRRVLQVLGGGAGAGSVALMLAAVGLYAVVTVAVGQRLREIGVRMALGARPSTVVASFFTDGMRTSLLGVLIGVPLSIAGLEMLDASNFLSTRGMPYFVAIVALLVASVASVASWIPARRAASVDPIIALRSD